MESIKIVLLICISIVFPVLVGSLPSAGLRAGKDKRTLRETYLYGCLLYGALIGMLSFVCNYAGVLFEKSAKLMLMMSVALLLACAVAFALWRGYRAYVKVQFAKCLKKPGKAELCVMCAFLLVACIYVMRPFPMELGFDTPERVVTMLDSGRLSDVNIWTGESAVTDVEQTLSTDYLPLFYACLCKWTGLTPAAVLFDVIPFLVLLQAFCVIALWVDAFFGNEKKMRGTALLLFALVTICGNAAYMNTSYGLLQYPYEAMTVFSSVLIPLAAWSVVSRANWFVTALVVVNALCLGGLVKCGVIFAVAVVCLVLTKLIFTVAERRKSTWT